MDVSIDRSGCTGCGVCAEICPDVFVMEDDGFAEVLRQPETAGEESASVEAAESCPVGVISINEYSEAEW